MLLLTEKSNAELLNSIKALKGNEDRVIAEIVLHLSEIDSRGVFRDIGFSSLFAYCRNGLGYSEGASCRRIAAARALKENPEIYELLAAGKISLCSISEVAKVKEPEIKAELLQSSIGKAKLEVQKLAAQYLPAQLAQKKEKISVKKVFVDNSLPLFQAPIKEETRTTFTVQVDEEFMALFEQAKAYVGSMPMAEVFKRTMKEFVSKRNKQPRQTRKLANTNSRYIPRITRYRVRQRDNQLCSYKSPCGHRCQESKALQIDHIVPFALGGTNDLTNLRLLCPAHNQLVAEQVFGRAKIKSYSKSR